MSKVVGSISPIMFVGTASDVGKSIITAGFCRVFKQDGHHPAPFKGQNMSLNSFVTPQGLEIGRAQAMQAEACGIQCETGMNPILLKPTNERSSQVVLNGRPIGTRSAYDYFNSENRHALFHEVAKAYERLSIKYSPIVMEGAGSIAELNLKQRDITNMRLAIHTSASTYLVGDIERGGIFGSLYGTIALLSPEEKKQIKGIIVNKFRGDIRLFEDGKKIIEDLCEIPVVGVLPYLKDIDIDEEDSVSLKRKKERSIDGKINIAVVLLDRISNFTDFARLERDPRVHLYYSNDPNELEKANIILLPGSKNTIEDFISINNSGVAKAIVSAFKNGKTIIGICGGYQMLGESIEDPFQVESNIGKISGLGILPVKTVMLSEKTTKQRRFIHLGLDRECEGYEIHMGETVSIGRSRPVNILEDGSEDGYYLNENCWGTYLHGILDNSVVVENILSKFTNVQSPYNHNEHKEKQYNKLADWIRTNVEMEKIYQSILK